MSRIEIEEKCSNGRNVEMAEKCGVKQCLVWGKNV